MDIFIQNFATGDDCFVSGVRSVYPLVENGDVLRLGLVFEKEKTDINRVKDIFRYFESIEIKETPMAWLVVVRVSQKYSVEISG